MPAKLSGSLGITTNLKTPVLVVLSIVLSTQCGCLSVSQFMTKRSKSQFDTTQLKAQGYSLPPGGMPTAVQLDPASGPRIVMEVRDGKDKHVETIPLPTDRGMTAEDLVQQAELHKKLGKVTLAIMRPVGAGNPPVRLDVRFDSKGKAENIGENYALLPNDHLIVVSDNRSHLERFIDKQFNR